MRYLWLSLLSDSISLASSGPVVEISSPVWYLLWIGYGQAIHFKWRHWGLPSKVPYRQMWATPLAAGLRLSPWEVQPKGSNFNRVSPTTGYVGLRDRVTRGIPGSGRWGSLSGLGRKLIYQINRLQLVLNLTAVRAVILARKYDRITPCNEVAALVTCISTYYF